MTYKCRKPSPAHLLPSAAFVRFLILSLCLTSTLSCNEGPAVRSRAGRDDNAAQGHAAGQSCVPAWQQVDDGVRYRTSGCHGDEFDLHVVEIDPASWTIDVVTGERRPMRAAVAETGARFAINANFFDVDDRTLGLVVTNGRVIQPPHPVSWQSIFSISDRGAPSITTREEWKRLASGTAAAAQAGPRLVIGGARNTVAKAAPSLRSGVCITGDRKVRFFVTPQDRILDVHEVLELAAKTEDAGGMSCHDAMLFDGGPSAQMHLDTRGRKFTIDGDRVPVYVVAKPRKR